MRRILYALVGVFFLSTPAWADTSSLSTTTSGMGVLENDYVKAGVNGTSGTLGSGGNTSPGLLYDSTGTGTFNTSYDYLTPGSPFDGFSVKILDTEGGTATNYTNNNQGIANITGVGSLTDAENSLTWNGSWSHSGTTWYITNTYILGTTSQFIDITSQITAGSDAHTVWFARFIDPDARAADGDSSATDNVIGYGAIPTTNVAFSEALSSRYALGLYTTNTNVTAGVNNWSIQADGYNGTVYTDGDGNALNYGQGDDTIGLSWVWTGVSAGDIITANYAYIFGPSAFGAAETAIDSGAAGGDTSILTGELTDVGSATDAAESGGTSAPTVVGSTSTSLKHFDITADGSVQSVSTVLYTASTDIYSDGSTGDVTTTTENFPSVSGRIDQYAVLDEINKSINRGLAYDPWRKGGAKNEIGEFFVNGNYDKVTLTNDYDATTKGFGMTGVINTPIDNVKAIVSVNKVGSEMTGEVSESGIEKIHGSIGVMAETDMVIATVSANYSKNDYDADRGLPYASYIPFSGEMINESKTEGKDMWVNGRVYVKANENIVPFIGGSYGKHTIDGVDETGFYLTARNIEAVDETEKYVEGGVRLMAFISSFDLYGQASYTTDKWLNAEAGVSYNVSENGSIGIALSRMMHEDTEINRGMLTGKIQF